MRLLLIILSFFVTILLLFSKENRNDTLTIEYHCKLMKPLDLNFDIATVVESKNGYFFMLPFVNFASQYLYKFEITSCRYENKISYPNDAKYCYIPSTDTNTWKSILNSPLYCYPCTFSFRAIVKDISNGNIYGSTYTLKKINDSDFLPIPLILRIDTPNIELLEIVNDTLWLLPLLEFGKKGNLLFCYGKKYLKDSKYQEYFVTLYDLSQKTHIYKILQSELERKLGRNLSRTAPITYFLDDSLGICYWYPLSPPIIVNFNQKNYSFFEYKGVLNDLVDNNFKSKIINGKTIRKFVYHFYSMGNDLIVLAGKNIGEKINEFELIELLIQYYDKVNFQLKNEKFIRLPNLDVPIKFFSSFVDSKREKLFFIFFTKDYSFYLYSLKL